MYLDYALFGFSAVLLVAAILSAALIFKRWARWKDDEKAVREAETERVEIYETMSRTLSAENGETSESWRNATVHTTEKLGNWRTGKGGETLNISSLNGKYKLLRELHEGNMSRVFLAEDVRIKNQCVVKFIATADPKLADEAEILKHLNHLGLPQVLDVIPSPQGLFLVERRVEGYSLSETLTQMRGQITRTQICEWGIQLAQILYYLHSLDTPIFHCDIKPSNIMVTHDNRLVLVDFGIAQRGGTADKASYATVAYAAPELLVGSPRGREFLQKRFGKIPDGAETWHIDERTDLYSVGVILYEMLTGKLPEKNTEKEVYRYATKNLGDIVCQCLRAEPMNRFRNARELSEALESVQTLWRGAPHRLWMRRAAIFVCCAALSGSIGTTASAVYIRQLENTAQIAVNPAHAAVSPRQSVVLKAESLYPDGGIQDMDLDRINWSYSEANIATLEGNRLMGLQAGTVTLTGTYRNKTAVIEVEVTEPVEEGVEVSLQYMDGVNVSLYAGGGARDQIDGTLSNSAFVSPASLDTDGQTLYLTDSGAIRVIQNGLVSTVSNLPSYLRAKLVRHQKSDLYFLTGDWEEDDGEYRYGIARYAATGETEILYETESGVTAIPDFAVSSDGTVWFIQQSFLEGITRLQTVDANQRVANITELPEGASNLIFDETENLYISVPDEGMIYRLQKGGKETEPFVGGVGERNFIDGSTANLYRPTSLAWSNDILYALDFDTVRKIQVVENGPAVMETIAGVPIPNTNPDVRLGLGSQAVFASDNGASLVVADNERLLLSDPKNNAIYQISMTGSSQTI